MQNGEQSSQAQNAINENAQSQTENKIHATILQMLAIFVITVATFRIFSGGGGK
jgi:ABC-type lipoprotein release transport system permease subunit